MRSLFARLVAFFRAWLVRWSSPSVPPARGDVALRDAPPVRSVELDAPTPLPHRSGTSARARLVEHDATRRFVAVDLVRACREGGDRTATRRQSLSWIARMDEKASSAGRG